MKRSKKLEMIARTDENVFFNNIQEKNPYIFHTMADITFSYGHDFHAKKYIVKVRSMHVNKTT